MKPTFGTKLANIDYHLRKGCYAIIINKTMDKVLTVHNGEGIHFLPGGGTENNESDVACIEREMLEETGYTVNVGSMIGSALHYFMARNNEYYVSDGKFYLAELGEKVQEPNEEDHLMDWTAINDIHKLFFYQH
ncbi:NUDIX domain-containing protein [Ornithinibacillus contaminans]|uniref:NUDIX domain-containing protein n=1 Tax=Ornithinibacillus contaminans TaxID=694055 RepID=UPI00064DFB4C|nr:NUDIX domain-containing protein [Ornithinibacillus contaminans]